MRKCPLCGKTYKEYPATSRIDNHTEICPQCGIREALEDFGMPEEEAKATIKEIIKLGKKTDCHFG